MAAREAHVLKSGAFSRHDATRQEPGKELAPPLCPLSAIIDRVGNKWTVMVVGHLSDRPVVRFNALLRAIPGVSHRMLTLTLRGLERDGLVKRTAYATVPPRVDYELTELGRSLKKPLSLLSKWASANQAKIAAAQTQYDERS
jgi:DNA-binding HxlR family transcriptional regulator